MCFLGLDASTTTCGWAITDVDRKILSCGFIDLTSCDTNREKAWAIAGHIKSLPMFGQIARVNLESALSGFSGPSSRTVVVKLARFSATLQYVLEDVFGSVNLINVATARKQAFGRARLKNVKPKIFVEAEIKKLYDLSSWEVRNKIDNVDKRMEDVRDAIVIAIFDPMKK